MNYLRFVTQPEPVETATARRRLTIGLPIPDTASGERRVPLTPEGVAMMEERGFSVLAQVGIGETIHYTDERYTRCGARMVSRAEALGCDIVISMSALSMSDIRQMRRGALLMTLLAPWLNQTESIGRLLQRQITAVGLDLVEDSQEHTPFADILAEVDGRAAVALASSLLADGEHGKGILLGGVSGIIPCEAVIIGSGIGACAAAKCASGLGAMVRMFDNDVYRLRRAARSLGSWLMSSALHPHVLMGALRTADIVVVTPTDHKVVIDSSAVKSMKSGAIIVDLAGTMAHPTFPSLPMVDMAKTRLVPDDRRVCLVNPGAAVARTAAMALSNTLVTLFDKISSSGRTFNDSLRALPGLRRAVYTFMGHVVNEKIARSCRTRTIDINIYLALS